MYKLPAIAFLSILPSLASAQIIISGVMANPDSFEDPLYEYVQLVAVQAIDFSANNYSMVVTSSQAATANGWAEGFSVTYKFDLTSGSVAAGGTFYVGGSGKRIDGPSSTSISSANWIRTINTGTTGGDGFGNANSGQNGVIGNGPNPAEGVAVFSGTTITASTVPVDALFFGSSVGTAKPATGGYKMPSNDLYTATGFFGDTGNSFLFASASGSRFTRLTGTYDSISSTWTTPRTASKIDPTNLSSISSTITLTAIPEPSTFTALLGLSVFVCAATSRRRAVTMGRCLN